MQFAKYGVSKTFYFALEEVAATSSDRFKNAAGLFVAGDSKISKDGGAVANTANLPTQISAHLYGIVLTAAEMEANDINVLIVDQDGPVWRDMIVQITTRLDIGFVQHTGKAQAGAASTITLAAGAPATNNILNENTIWLVGGTAAPQVRVITGYVGATKVATVNRPWDVNPDNTTIYTVVPGADVWDQLEGTEITNAVLTTAAGTRTFRTLVQAVAARFYHLVTQTATQQKVFKRDGVTTLATMAASDDGVTQSKGTVT